MTDTEQLKRVCAEATPGPYRAEFGAIYHETHAGFLFTVCPPERAEDVARDMNDKAELLTRIEVLEGERDEAREALSDAYTFISQPTRMESPAGGPKTATYRTENYNRLTAKIRKALGR